MKFKVGDMAYFDPGYGKKRFILCTIEQDDGQFYWPKFLEETTVRYGGWCHFRFTPVSPLIELAKCADLIDSE